ncbi:MAG TPA: AtpZ/AtpI family protein [Verrucomicrobiae bacterium]|nr:AtpZ/AtpI family protein [Verrucomicrobiae bacterium]
MNFGNDFRGMGRYMALGIQMVVTTAVIAAVGFWLDQKTGKGPMFLVVFFLLGSVAGFVVVYRGFRDSDKGAKPR